MTIEHVTYSLRVGLSDMAPWSDFSTSPSADSKICLVDIIEIRKDSSLVRGCLPLPT